MTKVHKSTTSFFLAQTAAPFKVCDKNLCLFIWNILYFLWNTVIA